MEIFIILVIQKIKKLLISLMLNAQSKFTILLVIKFLFNWIMDLKKKSFKTFC